MLQNTFNDLGFQSFDFESTSWRLFLKSVVWTKFDIYIFIISLFNAQSHRWCNGRSLRVLKIVGSNPGRIKQTNEHKTGICHISTTKVALRSKNWLAWNKDNVSEWSNKLHVDCWEHVNRLNSAKRVCCSNTKWTSSSHRHVTCSLGIQQQIPRLPHKSVDLSLTNLWS